MGTCIQCTCFLSFKQKSGLRNVLTGAKNTTGERRENVIRLGRLAVKVRTDATEEDPVPRKGMPHRASPSQISSPESRMRKCISRPRTFPENWIKVSFSMFSGHYPGGPRKTKTLAHSPSHFCNVKASNPSRKPPSHRPNYLAGRCETLSWKGKSTLLNISSIAVLQELNSSSATLVSPNKAIPGSIP